MNKELLLKRQKYAKMVHILRSVRPKIASGKEIYICNAISRIVKIDELPEAQMLIEWISRQLNGHYTAQDWLSSQGIVDVSSIVAQIKLREWRVEWIDRMIAELEGE